MASSKAAVRVIDSQAKEQPLAPLITELLERLDEDPQRARSNQRGFHFPRQRLQKFRVAAPV